MVNELWRIEMTNETRNWVFFIGRCPKRLAATCWLQHQKIVLSLDAICFVGLTAEHFIADRASFR